MLMKKVGGGVTNHPGLAIISVIIITLLITTGVYFKGLDQTFDEESFNPDIEMAHADSEIRDDFAKEYSVFILVKSKNENILTPSSLAEIIQMEQALAADSYLAKNFEDPDNPPANFNSIADQIIFIYLLFQNINYTEQLLDYQNSYFQEINDNLSYLQTKIDKINLSNNESSIKSLRSIERALFDNLSLLGNPEKKLGEFGGALGGSMDITFEQKIAILESISEQELIELIKTAMAYTVPKTTGILTRSAAFADTAAEGMAISAELIGNLTVHSMDPILYNSTLYNNSANADSNALVLINSSIDNSTNLAAAFGGYSFGIEAMDFDNITLQLDTQLGYLGGYLPYMLTKDFNPMFNKFQAKGTLVLVYFNASIGANGGGGGHGSDSARLTVEKKVNNVATEKYEWQDSEFSVIGENLIMDIIMEANTESLMILLVLIIIFVIVLLLLIYRSFFDMGLSLLSLGLGIMWVYGVGAWFGFTFNPITTMIPVLIVGLGIDYGIHLTLRYREERNNDKQIKQAMGISIASVGTALLLATVTTAIAFLSNLSSPLPLLAQFGILSAVGIVGCFVSMTIFMPALKQLRDLRKEKKRKVTHKELKTKSENKSKKNGKLSNLFNKGIATGATAASRYPGVVIGVTIIVTLASMYGVINLETKFDFEDFLPEGLDVTEDIDYMMNEFSQSSIAGEEQVYILIKGDIADPTVVAAIYETINNMEDDKYVNKQELTGANGNFNQTILVPNVESIFSLIDTYAWGTLANESFVALYFEAFDEDGQLRSDTTRDEMNDIYSWLYTNAEKDTKFLLHQNPKSDRFDSTVLRIEVSLDMDEKKSEETLDELNDDKAPLDKNSKVDNAIVTGGSILFTTTMKILNQSQIRSLVITVIMCSIILTIVFWYEKRSLVLGVITTLPVVLVISWSLGVMYIKNIPLNMMTITIASLTVGLGVTYGIHITHRFLESIETLPTIDEACRNTVLHTGTALFGAAATTIAAFGLLSFAILPPVQQFGFISALTIFFSFLSCVFVLPTILVLWARYRQKRGNLLTKKDKEPVKEEEVAQAAPDAEKTFSESPEVKQPTPTPVEPAPQPTARPIEDDEKNTNL